MGRLPQSLQELIDMELHEIVSVNATNDFIIRVPNGWIYGFPEMNQCVLVPEPYATVHSKEVPSDFLQSELDEELKRIEEVLDNEASETNISSESVHSDGESGEQRQIDSAAQEVGAND